MESIVANTAQPKLFGGMLEAYPQRALFVRTKADITQVIETLKKAQGVTDEISVQSAKISGKTPSGEASGKFDFFQLPGKPPVYCIVVPKPAAGGAAVKVLRDLAALTHAPIIVYVHESAVALIKIPSLSNFPSILFQSQEEVDGYFSSGLLGNDEKEVLFYCRQKQIYVTEKILLSGDYAKEKASRKKLQSSEDAESQDRDFRRPKTKKPEKESDKKNEEQGDEKNSEKEDRAKTSKAPSEDKTIHQLANEFVAHGNKGIAYAQAVKKGVSEKRETTETRTSSSASAPSRQRSSRQARETKAVETRSTKRTWILPEDDVPVARAVEPVSKTNVIAGIPMSAPLSIPAPQTLQVQSNIPPVAQPGMFGFPGGFGFAPQNLAATMTPAMWASVAQVATQMATNQPH